MRLGELPLAILRKMLADTERLAGSHCEAAEAIRREIERRRQTLSDCAGTQRAIVR